MSQKPQVGRTFRLNGGSKGEESFDQGAGNNQMFQKGVDYVYPSKKKKIKGRILPARDASLSPNDAAYKGSIVPYRDMTSGILDKQTESPEFTSFMAKVLCYKRLGRGGVALLSPQTLKAFAGDNDLSAEDTADPIRDIYFFLKNNVADYKDWEHWLDKETMGANSNRLSVIPRAKELALFNYYFSEDGKEFKLGILITAYMAWEHLKTQLCWVTPRSIEPVDKNFEDYLFGDITDPENGLLTTLGDIKVGEMGTTGFHISTKDFTINGIERKKGGVPQAILDKRYDLLSSEVLRIDSYQTIVEFLVKDNVFPYGLIQLACSGMADVPAEKSQNTTTSAPEKRSASPSTQKSAPDTSDDIPGVDNGRSPAPVDADPAPPEEDAPAPPEEDAPAPPDDEAPAPPDEPEPEPEPVIEYWVSHEGVRKLPLPEVQSILDIKPGLKLMAADKTGGWKPAAEFGLVPAAGASTPAKSQTTTTAPASTTPATATSPKATSTTSKLNAEEQVEFDGLNKRVQDPKNPLEPADMKRMVELMKKSKGQA